MNWGRIRQDNHNADLSAKRIARNMQKLQMDRETISQIAGQDKSTLENLE